MSINRLFSILSISTASNTLHVRGIHASAAVLASKPNLVKPKPGFGKSYRRIVHFPEDYTVKPLEVTNLAGRDPESDNGMWL
ncbi:unnamed protein product [Leptidea sinapis]|uniref:Uncharacterized protein n=1 Tax=Leptidea sinapis TaxID=189913 RepID=A0A5E4QGY9_9NEOP|nr:unnamed protein product [Leptidea sinapis]